MAEKLSCPSCNAPMEIEYLNQTDKIARCAYCGSVVDLPDELSTEKVTEIQEHEQSDGWTKSRNVRVSERRSSTQTPGVDLKEADDLFQQVEQMLKTAQSGTSNTANTQVTSKTYTVTSTTNTKGVNVAGDLPEEVRKLMSEFGAGSPPEPGQVKQVQVSFSNAPAKRSLWKRLFGKD